MLYWSVGFFLKKSVVWRNAGFGVLRYADSWGNCGEASVPIHSSNRSYAEFCPHVDRASKWLILCGSPEKPPGKILEIPSSSEKQLTGKWEQISAGLILSFIHLSIRSNIKPEKATANNHHFQMFTFEKTTNCKACKMFLRWGGRAVVQMKGAI